MTDAAPRWTMSRLCAALGVRLLLELPPRCQTFAERIMNCSEMLIALDDKRAREGSESAHAARLRAMNEKEMARFLALLGLGAGRAE